MKLIGILVNYNAGRLLEKAVTAALAADPPMFVIVVDNNSTDNSLSYIESLIGDGSRLQIVRNDENLGFARANNHIIESTPADFYALINPDCVVMPDTVAKLVDTMKLDGSVGLASGTIRNADGTMQKTCRRDFPTPWSGLVRSLGLGRLFGNRKAFGDFDRGNREHKDMGTEYVEAVSGALMVVRGSALEKVGLLDEGYFMHCEDLDWCMRFWLTGYKVAFVPDAVAIHYKGGSGRGLRVNWHLHKGMLRFYRKFYRDRYPLPVTWMVYAGIAARFVAQSILVAMSTAWRRISGFGTKERIFE